MDRDEKPIVWIGSVLEDLRAFPDSARRRAGHELHRLQSRLMPSDWRPMRGVGAGCYEIRISTEGARGRVEHRVFYVAKFEEAIYVLHAFRKTTRATSRRDMAAGRRRYAEMSRRRASLDPPAG